MASAERRAREKESLRRAILDAARELFATEDYKAVSMRRIAEKIEYSPTAIYLHFKDKDEILGQLILEGFALLSERLESSYTADPIERLRRGGKAYFDFALSQPHYYRIMFQQDNKPLMEKYQAQNAMGPDCFGFLLKAVIEAINAGKFDTNPSEIVTAHVLWSNLHGAVSLALSGHLCHMMPDHLQSAFFDAVIETSLTGLMTKR